jgi:two-component system chemotaxis sensor kinase CheA
MAINLDDEILQDFLVEAGEILVLLGEQLVDLEQTPDNKDLLNAVFRGFHTVKGGAGFLAIDPMVSACHVCEDVFNVLRQGERKVSPALMDAVLQGLDCVQVMFTEIREGIDPTPADPDLLARLKQYAKPGQDEVAEPVQATARSAEKVSVAAAEHDETDDEFDALLDAMDAAPAVASSTDEITDDEFENLLDQIHGKGKHTSLPVEKIVAAKPAATTSADDDAELINDEEFDKILDSMHGKGKGPTGGKSAVGQKPAVPADIAADGDEAITDEDFDKLMDSLHGAGKGPTATAAASASPKPAAGPAVKAVAPAPAPKVADKPVDDHAAGKSVAPAAETSVRVDTERLDQIMNLVGELVLVRNRLQTLRATMGEGQVTQAIVNLDMVTSDLQTAVMKTRMQPIKKVFGRFPRVVRDLSRQIKKEIKLEMMGEETDLDKNLVEALADPLVHLVRNAVDHGIEMPEVREKKGKSREGTVILSAQQEGDHILLSIEDDGAGMDPVVLRKKAVEKGMMDEDTAARLSDKEAYNLIFAAGFSTKEQITDISGRGVGMDVVKTRITQLNGSLDIQSELGKGTCLTIKVPLTLAILPTLMIALGARTFALPLSNVNEIFELNSRKTNVIDGQQTVMVREKAVPLFYLSRWLLKPGDKPKYGEGQGQVIIVSLANRMVGLVTDHVVGQEEVVIKPLGGMLQKIPGLAGSTITGDGGIALILDVQSLLKARARKGY